MKADFAKHFTGGALRNLKKVKSRKIKYDENIISFTLGSKIGRKKLGKFKCTFDITSTIYYNLCTMDNLTYPNRPNPHPHIEEDEPCLGDFYIPMREALDSGELDELVRLSQLFLNSYSDDYYCGLDEVENSYLVCGCFIKCECEDEND